MKRSISLFLRAGMMALIISSMAVFTGPAQAAVGPVEDAVPPSVVGACVFQGATIEGTATAVLGVSSQTGIGV